MDIHKPKPWHGVREFLKEYVIIVIGVLTALGAEAVVQNLHEARLSREAQIAVLDEMNVDIASTQRRLDSQNEACLPERLNEITALLDRAEAGQAFTPAVNVGGPRQNSLYTQRWAAATAGGRTSLLSSDLQRKFGRVYEAVQRMDEYQHGELNAWLTLHALRGLRHLSPEMIHDQRLAVSRARDYDSNLRRALGGAKFYAGQLGVKGDAHLIMTPSASVPEIPEACQPMTGSPPVAAGR